MTINPKVAAGGAAGALTIILVWIVRVALGLEVPGEVASALTTLLSFGAGWLVKAPAQGEGHVGAGDAGLSFFEVVVILLGVAVFLLAIGWIGPGAR